MTTTDGEAIYGLIMSDDGLSLLISYWAVKSKKELQRLVPAAALARGSLTNVKDLMNYFSMIDSDRILIPAIHSNTIWYSSTLEYRSKIYLIFSRFYSKGTCILCISCIKGYKWKYYPGKYNQSQDTIIADDTNFYIGFCISNLCSSFLDLRSLPSSDSDAGLINIGRFRYNTTLNIRRWLRLI